MAPIFVDVEEEGLPVRASVEDILSTYVSRIETHGDIVRVLMPTLFSGWRGDDDVSAGGDDYE